MKKFKVRCSALGHICTGSNGITEKQKETIATLQAKDKITDKQQITLDELIHKRDNPVLPTGAKTYCEDWLKGQLLDYRTIFSNKYTQKGHIMEDESLDFIAEHLGFGMLIKNEEYLSNEYIDGTPDVRLKQLIIDVKNSWDASTFPMFESEVPKNDYYWQLMGYMWLDDKPSSKLIYTLMDTPEHLIEREARWYSISQGFDELEDDIYKMFLKNMTYKNIDPKYRIKVFEVERNEDDIQLIKDRVIQCREYIKTLL